MLLMSGNVQPNPGPVTDMTSLQTPADFLKRSGIGFVHINVRSLLPKIDKVRIWAKNFEPHKVNMLLFLALKLS